MAGEREGADPFTGSRASYFHLACCIFTTSLLSESLAEANVCIIYEKTKRQIPLRTSLRKQTMQADEVYCRNGFKYMCLPYLFNSLSSSSNDGSSQLNYQNKCQLQSFSQPEFHPITSSGYFITEGVITTRSNRMKFRLIFQLTLQ